MHLTLTVLISINLLINTHGSNAANSKICATKEYFDVYSDNCEYNPDAYLDAPQIIRRRGYAAEAHIVETQDGYLLTLHRIPGPKNGTRGGQPVFVQHGLLSSSADWVDVGDKYLPFLLADSGYDVWLGNARGNTYSKAHLSLPIYSSQYWNFSWHEMGVYDLPAAFKYVENITGKYGDIIYIGHSMGTTMFFVYSSVLPEEAAKSIKIMVALAPVAYMTHIKSPIRYLAPFGNNFEWLAEHLGINQFLPNNRVAKFLAYNCELFNEKKFCEEIIFTVCGFDRDQFNSSLLPVIGQHSPAGTSTKTVVHYVQEIAHEGAFQEFDYGTQGNLRQYGTPAPPKYNLTDIKVPTYLFYGDNDLLASPIDVKRLAQKLKNNVGVYEVPFSAFNHIDFILAKDAPKLVYEPLIKIIKQYPEEISNEV